MLQLVQEPDANLRGDRRGGSELGPVSKGVDPDGQECPFTVVFPTFTLTVLCPGKVAIAAPFTLSALG